VKIAETVGDVLDRMDGDAAYYEAWRPALSAFWRIDGALMRADNVGKLGFPLDYLDRRTIDGLAAAARLAPRAGLRAAA
jgi:hypothetical protein